MSEIFEIAMICLFGASWPMNVIKSYKARTAKGKSFMFLLFIFKGYVFGVAAKFTNEAYMSDIASKWYVLFFYFLNMLMVATDIALYFRNRYYDKKSDEKVNEI